MSPQNQNIVFMFLGGIPSPTSEVGKSWQLLVRHMVSTRFVCISHNDKQVQESPPQKFWCGKIPSYQLPPEMSIATSWGTHSITAATLLMMQEARQRWPVKKFILLSSTCCPVCPLDRIDEYCFRDDKSWFYPFTDDDLLDLDRFYHSYVFDFEGGPFSMYHYAFVSQWFVMDERHANFFFLDNPKHIPTYLPVRAGFRCRRDDVGTVQLNPLLRHLTTYNVLKQLVDSFQEYKMDRLVLQSKDPQGTRLISRTLLPCVISDEHFFMMILLFFILGDETNPETICHLIHEHFTTHRLTSGLMEERQRQWEAFHTQCFVIPNESMCRFQVTDHVPYRVDGRIRDRFYVKKKYGDEAVYRVRRKMKQEGEDQFHAQRVTSENDPRSMKTQYRQYETSQNDPNVYVNMDLEKTMDCSDDVALLPATFVDWCSISLLPSTIVRTFIQNMEIRNTKGLQTQHFVTICLSLDSLSDVIDYMNSVTRVDMIHEPVYQEEEDGSRVFYFGVADIMGHPIEYGSCSIKTIRNFCILVQLLLYHISLQDWAFFPALCESYEHYFRETLGLEVLFHIPSMKDKQQWTSKRNDEWVIPIQKDAHHKLEKKDMLTKQVSIHITAMAKIASNIGCMFIRKCQDGCGIYSFLKDNYVSKKG